jgi:hypothetical protein
MINGQPTITPWHNQWRATNIFDNGTRTLTSGSYSTMVAAAQSDRGKLIKQHTWLRNREMFRHVNLRYEGHARGLDLGAQTFSHTTCAQSFTRDATNDWDYPWNLCLERLASFCLAPWSCCLCSRYAIDRGCLFCDMIIMQSHNFFGSPSRNIGGTMFADSGTCRTSSHVFQRR